MESTVSEKIHLEKAFDHADVAGQETDLIGLSGAVKMRCFIRVENVAQDLVLTLRQSKDAAGTDKKDLVRCLPAYEKVGANVSVIDEDNTASITFAGLNGAAGYAIVEFQGSDLDDGYTHVSIAMASGAPRNGHAHYEADTNFKPAIMQVLK